VLPKKKKKIDEDEVKDNSSDDNVMQLSTPRERERE